MQHLSGILSLKIICISILLTAANASAQSTFNVLHYTETSGFDHNTRANSLSMFQGFSNLNITDDQTGVEFDTLSNLLSYDLIIFSNTSGDAILDSTQQNHFEQYIQQGGALLGLHAATDTYRHSSANGNSTGTWDFYAETLGGSVQQNPNHVARTPAYDIHKIGTHPTTDSLPDPWNKNEEYYYWENGYLDSSISVILEVEITVGPNNQINSYDSARAVSWYKVLNSGSRVFYTSMGHANSNFNSDTLFEKHLEDAVKWCLAISTSLENDKVLPNNKLMVYPNPAKNILNVELESNQNSTLAIYSLDGQLVLKQNVTEKTMQIDLNDLISGVYFLEIVGKDTKIIQKVIKK